MLQWNRRIGISLLRVVVARCYGNHWVDVAMATVSEDPAGVAMAVGGGQRASTWVSIWLADERSGERKMWAMVCVNIGMTAGRCQWIAGGPQNFTGGIWHENNQKDLIIVKQTSQIQAINTTYVLITAIGNYLKYLFELNRFLTKKWVKLLVINF